jgi:hypothetical protein
MENHNIFLIEPQMGQIVPADLKEDRSAPGLEGARGEFLKGNATVFTLPTGDRIIAGPRGFGVIDTTSDDFKAISRDIGAFAVLPQAIDPTDPEAKIAFTSGEDPFLAEIVGPAILVGPKPEEGEDDFTPTSVTIEELRRRVAFNRSGMMGNPLSKLLEALMRMPEAPEVADGGEADERPWDESVFDPELVDYRKTLTDEELAECPCPGCKEEQERRVKAAGGSTAKN